MVGGWAEGTARLAVSDAVLLISTFPAIVFSALAARAATGRLRLAWVAMTVGALGWGIGQAIGSFYELFLNQVPFPSPADAAYLVFPFGACACLLLFPIEHTGSSRGRVILDGLIVAGSLFLVSWVTILGPLYSAGGTDQFTFIVSLAYPVTDLVVLTVAGVVLVRSGVADRFALTLLTVGVACIALSDSLWTYLTVKDQYASGDVIDIGWAAGFLLITVAAAASREASHAGLRVRPHCPAGRRSGCRTRRCCWPASWRPPTRPRCCGPSRWR